MDLEFEITEKEAEEYNEKKVMENIISKGENVIKAHLEHLKSHGQFTWFNQALDFLKEKGIKIDISQENSFEDNQIKSEISNWPIQLHLINPLAPYFKNSDLLIAADCMAFSFANFHGKIISEKVI